MQAIVIAQKREEAERYPFDAVTVVGKPATHFLRRTWFKQIRDMPWQISRREVNAFIRILENAEARLLHIYFGHIAVHLLPLIRAWEKPAVVSIGPTKPRQNSACSTASAFRARGLFRIVSG